MLDDTRAHDYERKWGVPPPSPRNLHERGTASSNSKGVWVRRRATQQPGMSSGKSGFITYQSRLNTVHVSLEAKQCMLKLTPNQQGREALTLGSRWDWLEDASVTQQNRSLTTSGNHMPST